MVSDVLSPLPGGSVVCDLLMSSEQQFQETGVPLQQTFALAAKRLGGRPALRAPDGERTYAELSLDSEALAHRLLSRGVREGDRVAVICERSVAFPVAVLGIWQAGAAYVPIDPRVPERRQRASLEVAEVAAVVCSEGVQAQATALARPFAAPVISVPRERGDSTGQREVESPERPCGAFPRVGGDAAAYVIFTSGSTGEPKGVVVEHRQVSALLQSCHQVFGFGEGDTWSCLHSFAFDFSVWEIWGALLLGGTCVIGADDLSRDPSRVLRLFLDEKVTMASLTPSAFRELAHCAAQASEHCESLRHIVFGGERLPVSVLRPWVERYGFEQPLLTNAYGITETTVHVTHRRLVRADLDRPEISPLGVPLPTWEVVLVGEGEEEASPVADGEVGEMYVGGRGVARGYLGREALTAERFVLRDLGRGRRRYYRSGDLAVRAPDGQLVYRGRIDDQLQLRGYRVEPGEVERVLLEDSDVESVVVVVVDHGDGDQRLTAYLCPREGADRHEERLRARCEASLPSHCRPSRFVFLASFPVTHNGKVNRAQLSRPEAAGAAATEHSTRPMPRDTQRDWAETAERSWWSLLGGESRDARADFFELGGTSLSFVRLLRHIRDRTGLRPSTARLLARPTLEQLLIELARLRGESAQTSSKRVT